MTAGELSQILMAFAVLISSVAGLVVAVRTGQKVSATHDLVNGASEQLNALREARGREAGLAQGLQIQHSLLKGESGGPGDEGLPAIGAQVLGAVPPASPQMDTVPSPGNQTVASRARALRQGRPK